MKTLLCILLFAIAAQAQTTFWFPLDTAADVDVAVQSGWEESGEVLKRKLVQNKGNSTITAGNIVDITEDTANQALDRQYVSAQMNAGITFTSGVTTVNMTIMMREHAATDDVNQCIIGIRVMDAAGTTLRATLLAVANYGTTDEFLQTGYRNKICADGDTVTASYTTAASDRLVVEFGYQTDGANTTPQASANVGEDATDCAADDTGTTACAGWITFSNTITFVNTGPTIPVTTHHLNQMRSQ